MAMTDDVEIAPASLVDSVPSEQHTSAFERFAEALGMAADRT